MTGLLPLLRRMSGTAGPYFGLFWAGGEEKRMRHEFRKKNK